jgi:hypothetical protein
MHAMRAPRSGISEIRLHSLQVQRIARRAAHFSVRESAIKAARSSYGAAFASKVAKVSSVIQELAVDPNSSEQSSGKTNADAAGAAAAGGGMGELLGASPASSSAIRLRAATSSAWSLLVMPGTCPESTSCWRRQVQMHCALISRSCATRAAGLPAATRSRTIRRNSGGYAFGTAASTGYRMTDHPATQLRQTGGTSSESPDSTGALHREGHAGLCGSPAVTPQPGRICGRERRPR